MRAYRCPRCAAMLDGARGRCPRCGAPVGLALPLGTVLDLETMGAGWKRCIGSGDAECNWLVTADGGPRCESCRLTRTVPAGRDPSDLEHLSDTELAKRRVVYQLYDLGLPVVDRAQDPARGLAFDLLSSRYGPVVTGHADGVITIDLAESDDAHRVMLQAQLDEPYRTVVGHIRHEIGHYYWMVLVEDGGHVEAFRALFGDERASYPDALQRHYREGAPPGWRSTYVSAYATMHPWEDWAETFAHYLHIIDAAETAEDYAVMAPSGVRPTSGDFGELLEYWRFVVEAVNGVAESLGLSEVYPFTPSGPVVDKLHFVHRSIAQNAQRRSFYGPEVSDADAPPFP